MLNICALRVPEDGDEIKNFIASSLGDNNTINVNVMDDGSVDPRLTISITAIKIRNAESGMTKMYIAINMIKVLPDFFCETYHKNMFVDADKADAGEVAKIISKACIKLLAGEKKKKRVKKPLPRYTSTKPSYTILKRSGVIQNNNNNELVGNPLSQSSQIVTSSEQGKLDWSEM